MLEDDPAFKEFIDRFNELASKSDSVEVIDDSTVDVVGGNLRLFESPELRIGAQEDTMSYSTMYFVVINSNQPYNNFEGEGYETTMLIGEALGMDTDELSENFEDSLTKFRHNHTQHVDNDKRRVVNFLNYKDEDSDFEMDARGLEIQFSKAYALLREALKDTGKIGITKMMIKSKEQLAVIRVHEDAIVVETIHYPDEV
ncbi:Ku protein [Gracilibacillus alcaliphilus]|nr:hypothetical protein [Gracilibacillus alcaliphilus]